QRDPSRVISVFLLEITHLRLAGFYRESADVARQLRRYLNSAQDNRRINRRLLAFAELHAGISLQVAGFSLEARWAYETAELHTRELRDNFLIADVTGKLALSHALEANVVHTHHWLTAHNKAVKHVKWGYGMVT